MGRLVRLQYLISPPGGNPSQWHATTKPVMYTRIHRIAPLPRPVLLDSIGGVYFSSSKPYSVSKVVLSRISFSVKVSRNANTPSPIANIQTHFKALA